MRLAELEHAREDEIVVARIRGEVDMSNAEELRYELTRVTPNQALALVLDLTEVEYLDSAGIHLVYRLREDLSMRGQGFRLVIPSDSPVIDTLRLAGLTLGADAMPTLEAARESLGADRSRIPKL